jgi:hypothetical protein
MEWLRWIITIAALAGTAYVARDYGRTEMLAQMREQAIAERDAVNDELREQLDAGKAQAEQERVDLVALQTSIEQISARTGSIGSQLRTALNASNLSTCVLPVDVQRVRADAYEQARAAAASANQARAGG